MIPNLTNKAYRRITSWITFFAALLTYILTLEPSASYWDCPEYIVTAFRLEPGHPPGNPVWSLTARIFSLFAPAPEYVAYAVNLSSAIFTAAATALLASSIYIILQNIVRNCGHIGCDFGPKSHYTGGHLGPKSQIAKRQRIFRSIISLAASMTFAWADSPWFSAVEAEVYAMSIFLTALCFRLMLGWAFTPDRRQAKRILILIAYITGLSIGVHQLNLLVIPALALIWLYRRHHKPSFWRISATILISFLIIAAILFGIMPATLWLAGRCEIFCVNTLHLPYHSGIWIFWAITLTTLIGVNIGCDFGPKSHYIGCYFGPKSHALLSLSYMLLFLMIGFSAYFILLVRGAANPPMNEGAPSDIFALSSYMQRDQYGSTPLLYGRTPYSKMLRKEVIDSSGKASYSQIYKEIKAPKYTMAVGDSTPRYIHYSDYADYRYPPELDMLLPRLTSGDPQNIAAYADWAGMSPKNMTEVEVSYAVDSLGNAVGRLQEDGTRVKEKALRPTYLQQMRYLFGYQIGYMYLRYLMWNYSGRQNDRFAAGEVEHGNFITGIAPIDDAMLGPQSMLPDEIGKQNRGHNTYFLLPLILAILGIIALFPKTSEASTEASPDLDCGPNSKNHRGPINLTHRDNEMRTPSPLFNWNLIILFLFLMTGLAIVFYLNQTPREPRERDYSFLGSFWAFSIWIAAGMAWLFQKASSLRRRPIRRIATAAAITVTIFTPAWMLYQNYDDHDRSGRYAATDYAKNILMNLEPDAIIFINGDNYTFPLWYAQEVLGIRRDVTTINTAYLSTPWYAIQLMRPGEVSLPVEMQARPEDLAYGKFSYALYYAATDSSRSVDAVEALRTLYADTTEHPRLASRLRIPMAGKDSLILATSKVAGKNYLPAASLMTLDIIASNMQSPHPRPVYWLQLLPESSFIGLKEYTAPYLQVRRLMLDGKDSLAMTAPRDIFYASGGADKPSFYADATIGPMITQQRTAMLRQARRLYDVGYPAEALAMAKKSQHLFPHTVWEFQVINDSESLHHEGYELAYLLIDAGTAVGDKQAVAEGEALIKREDARYAQWRRYRNSLPPRLRNFLTPKNLRKCSQSS